MKCNKLITWVLATVMTITTATMAAPCNVNAADAVNGRYGTFTRTEPTTEQITTHDTVQYYLGAAHDEIPRHAAINSWERYTTNTSFADTDAQFAAPYSVTVSGSCIAYSSGRESGYDDNGYCQWQLYTYQDAEHTEQVEVAHSTGIGTIVCNYTDSIKKCINTNGLYFTMTMLDHACGHSE